MSKKKKKVDKVTPIRKPPEAGSRLDEAAAFAGYGGKTGEWAGAVLHAEADRLLAEEPAPAIEKDWKSIASKFDERRQHLRNYLIIQFLPGLAAKARVVLTQAQLIKDAGLMVDDIESGAAMARAHEEQKAVKPYTEAQAKAELGKRGK